MQVAILLYEGVTALDAIGPYEVLQAPPLGTEVRFVAREKGLKRTDFGRLGLMADYTLEETPRPDILLVPGTPRPNGGSTPRSPATSDSPSTARSPPVRRTSDNSRPPPAPGRVAP